MISSLRNFAKTKIAAVFIFIIIIPFVFWGMGSMFNSGNTNNIAKINNSNISTQDFMDYLNESGISQQAIRDNLENNVNQLYKTIIKHKNVIHELNIDFDNIKKLDEYYLNVITKGDYNEKQKYLENEK